MPTRSMATHSRDVPTEHPIVIFDGICNFCAASVQLVLKNDVDGTIRFAPSQSEAGQRLMARYGLQPEDTESVVLLENEKAYLRSDAALGIARHLRWRWRWMRIFRVVPTVLRDVVYDFIARNRYKWFGQRESCYLPSADERARFLDQAKAVGDSRTESAQRRKTGGA